MLAQVAALSHFNKDLASVCRSPGIMNFTAAAAALNKEVSAAPKIRKAKVISKMTEHANGSLPHRQLRAARPSVRISVPMSDKQQNQRRQTMYLDRFYSASPTGVRLYEIKGTPVVYLEMWKVASETINNHLIYHANNKTRMRWKYREQIRNYSYTTLRSYYRDLDKFYGGARPKIFTFVRNPISRFVSALGESYFRRWMPRPLQQNISKMPSWALSESLRHSVDTTKARWLLDAVISGDIDVISKNLEHIEHFFPMSNRLREFLPDYVGRLETMAADWSLLQPLLGIDIPDPSASTRSHASSQDPFSLVRSVNQVLTEDPRYLRALCALLWRDFVCFSLPFPAKCQDMAPLAV